MGVCKQVSPAHTHAHTHAHTGAQPASSPPPALQELCGGGEGGAGAGCPPVRDLADMVCADALAAHLPMELRWLGGLGRQRAAADSAALSMEAVLDMLAMNEEVGHCLGGAAFEGPSPGTMRDGNGRAGVGRSRQAGLGGQKQTGPGGGQPQRTWPANPQLALSCPPPCRLRRAACC